MKPFIILSIWLLSASLALAEVRVSGDVKLDNVLVGNGKITFHLPNGQFTGSRIEKGLYHFDVPHTGRYWVTVEGPGIPDRYTNTKTSGLQVEVTDGGNFINFEVTSK